MLKKLSVIRSVDLPLDPQSTLPVPGEHISPKSPVRISSQALFLGTTEIEIEHNGALYRLRQTSLGKLILTK
jgi:hemin uptake protein HemP